MRAFGDSAGKCSIRCCSRSGGGLSCHVDHDGVVLDRIEVRYNMDKQKLYRNFDRYLTALKLSASSRIAYRQNVLTFLRWAEAGTIDEPEMLIASYVHHLQSSGLKTSSVKSAQTALEHFRRCVGQSNSELADQNMSTISKTANVATIGR